MVIENAEFVSSDESSGDEEEEQVKMGTVRVAWYPIGTEEVGLISCRLSIILPALNSFLQFLYGSFFYRLCRRRKLILQTGTVLHYIFISFSDPNSVINTIRNRFFSNYYPDPTYIKKWQKWFFASFRTLINRNLNLS